MATADEDLRVLDSKVKQLKLDYEQYFLGTRPRVPQQLRSEVAKLIHLYLGTPIQNTALRFRFNSINSRFQAHKRYWDETLRKIETGTYERHVFKARLHERARGIDSASVGKAASRSRSDGQAKPGDLFESYRDAALACGQDVSKITPEKLQRVIERQRAAVRKQLGCDEVAFRVVVQDGKVKLKASRA